jgi:hypothetical protein
MICSSTNGGCFILFIINLETCGFPEWGVGSFYNYKYLGTNGSDLGKDRLRSKVFYSFFFVKLFF